MKICFTGRGNAQDVMDQEPKLPAPLPPILAIRKLISEQSIVVETEDALISFARGGTIAGLTIALDVLEGRKKVY